MPQKKIRTCANSSAERQAVSTGISSVSLTVMKGLPLAYDKDMQEDKEGVFDAIDTSTLPSTSMPA